VLGPLPVHLLLGNPIGMAANISVGFQFVETVKLFRQGHLVVVGMDTVVAKPTDKNALI
jgi:hypothetical protein